MELQRQNPAEAIGGPLGGSPDCAPAEEPDARPSGEAAEIVAELQEKLEKTLRAFKLRAARQVATDFPKITRKFLDRSADEFGQLAADASARLRDEIKSASDQITGEMHSRILANADEIAASRLAGLEDAAKRVMEEALQSAGERFEERVAAASGAHDAALRSMADAADAALAKLEASRQSAESAFTSEMDAKLAAISAAGAQEAERGTRNAAEAVQALLGKALDELKQKAAERIEADLPAAAATLLESSNARLEQQTGEARERLLADLRTQGTALLAQARDEFANFEKSSAETLSRSTEAIAERAVHDAVRNVEEQARAAIDQFGNAAVARVESEQQKLQTRIEISLAEHQKQMLQVSTERLDNFRRQLESELESFRSQLQSNVQRAELRAAEKAEAEIPRAAAGLVENATAAIERKIKESSGAIEETIRTTAEEIASRAGRRMVDDTNESLRSLRESAVEQGRNQLQALAKDIAGARRKEFESDLEAFLKKQRKLIQQRMDEAGRETLAWLQQASAGLTPGPAPKASSTSRWLLVVVALIPTLLFLYLMSRPVMRLNPDPPADFLSAYPEWTAQHQDVAAKLGDAYWDWAALHLVQEYPFGSDLPKQPPISFQVEGQGFPAGVDADVARMRYWNKLRELWKDPKAWQKVDAWNAR